MNSKYSFLSFVNESILFKLMNAESTFGEGEKHESQGVYVKKCYYRKT